MNRNNIPNTPFRYNIGASFDSCMALESRCKSDQECPQCHLYPEALAAWNEQFPEDEVELKEFEVEPSKRALRRHKDYYKAKRLFDIAKRTGFNVKELGRLRKGKIHCSCKMCKPGHHFNIEKPKYYEKYKTNYVLEYKQYLSDEHDYETFAWLDEMEKEDKYYEGISKAHEVVALIQEYKTNHWFGEEFTYYFNKLVEG